ncbi:MAG: DUF4340 domain-containing protein [Acidobacteria bacterium]|nr:DUF4340 domain-containing protein [Acidobacteriota bacterium]MDA1234978.1 DUF4340 domain-containing protein [Acidobacteriota bacterium]
MKQNPLLIAVLVLVVLGGFVYYTRENPPEPESDTVPMVRVSEAAISKVTVVKPGSETIVVQREADQPWTFGNGVIALADDSAINFMITNLASLDASRVVQDETVDWVPYGLDGDGQLKVTVEAEGDPNSIIFGEDTPTGSAVFARLDGDPRLFTTFSYARDNFDKTVFDWRDKRFLRVSADTTTTLSLEVGPRRLEFAKDSQNWRIVEPADLRADRLAVGDLERELANARMSSVLAEGDEAALSQFSAARPYAVAEIVDAGGSHVLTIAQGGPSGYYAKSSDLPGGVYEAPESLAASLDKDLAEYRDRKLFDFGFGDLSRIDVRDGDMRATIERQGDKWLLSTDGSRELVAEQVQALIDSLRNISAIDFPANDAAAQSRYGLGTPVIEAATTLALDGATVEKVVMTDPSQPQVYAARVGEGPTYEVEKDAADKVRQALDDILNPAASE